MDIANSYCCLRTNSRGLEAVPSDMIVSMRQMEMLAGQMPAEEDVSTAEAREQQVQMRRRFGCRRLALPRSMAVIAWGLVWQLPSHARWCDDSRAGCAHLIAYPSMRLHAAVLEGPLHGHDCRAEVVLKGIDRSGWERRWYSINFVACQRCGSGKRLLRASPGPRRGN